MIDILMENNMTALPFDILINCILPCRKTLPTLLRVSKHWNQILSNDRIWRLLLHLRLEKESNWLIEMGVANAAPNPRALYKELAFLSNEYHYPIQLILTSLTSSSFDSPRQTIKKTTELDPFSFWSSTGTDTDDTDEFLDYQLVHYTSMITSIHIKSFLAQYQRGLPYYAPKEISFSIAFTKFHKPHYISKRYPVKDSPDVQVFPLDNIVIGGYIKLHLHGKYNTQSSDGKYYTAIESVLIMGVPTTNLNKYPELSTTYSNWFDLIQLDQSILNNQFHHPELLVHEALVENEQLDMDMSVIGISEISSEFLSVNNEHEFEEMEMSNLEKQSKINGRVQRLLDTRHRENSALEYCKHLFDTLDYIFHCTYQTHVVHFERIL
ncbi:hypothetical protein BC833DRAFT_77034 [Globomyces pollinis-pini]|nr:hypothetical protein BC833DRAFT_77034 [Globomyces pollinis-pini]